MFGREPDPHRPLDGDYVQKRWVRLYRPGPWRVAVMVPTVLVMALAMTVVVTAALATPGHIAVRMTGLVVAAAIAAAIGLFLTRILTTGVYVNDEALRMLSLRSTRVVPWSGVVDVRRVPGPQPMLGLPIRSPHAEQVVLVLSGGDDLATPVTSVSADFLGRAEAFDIAAMALERWWAAGRA
jgi:uncharacterized membrane protein (DUF485 family)